MGVIAIPTTFRLHSLHNNKYGTDHFYSTKPDGYCSDEDNEQPSAWDVFSALGFYPMCPGADEYAVLLLEVVVNNVSYLQEDTFQFKVGRQHTLSLIINSNPDQVPVDIGGEIVGGRN